MFKKLIALSLVLMTVFALMIPAFAGAEPINTTTRILEDGTKLVYMCTGMLIDEYRF